MSTRITGTINRMLNKVARTQQTHRRVKSSKAQRPRSRCSKTEDGASGLTVTVGPSATQAMNTEILAIYFTTPSLTDWQTVRAERPE